MKAEKESYGFRTKKRPESILFKDEEHNLWGKTKLFLQEKNTQIGHRKFFRMSFVLRNKDGESFRKGISAGSIPSLRR